MSLTFLDQSKNKKQIIPVILCGGAGSRLWPLSCDEMPKQLLPIIGNNILLHDTLQRAYDCSGCKKDEIITITTERLKNETIKQINEFDPLASKHIIAEPESKNTAAAIAYATGDSGIEVSDSRNVDIALNLITETAGNGIDVHGSRNVDIFLNGVFLTGEDGIHVGNSRNANILFNLVGFAGGDGIDVHDSNNANISNNTVVFVADNGIELQGSNNSNITDNYVQFAGDNGIYVNPSNNVEITGNFINDVADDGIDVNDGDNILIDNNFIGTLSGNIGDDGIDVDGSSNVTISNNQITAANEAGIELTDTDLVNVLFNNIYDNASYGLWGRGPDNTVIIVSGNSFTNNDVHANFESGLIDLTGDSNIFTDGRVGLRFAPFGGTAPLSLVDDDGAGGYGGTIGAQIFDGQSDYYVELADGAFFAPGNPTLLNALDSTYVGTPFGTFTPNVDYAAGFPLGVALFLESMFYHYNDNGSLGLFDFPLLPLIDQEDIFNYFGPRSGARAGLNLTILGLPGIPGAPRAFNSITPAAGDNTPTNPADLNAIETAAGGEEASCWGDALNMAATGAVNLSYSGSAEDLLIGESNCGS